MMDADLYHPNLAGCSDGGCIIKPPAGMHTNGGCGCEREIRRAGHRGTDAIRTIHYLRSELRKKATENTALAAQVEGLWSAAQEYLANDGSQGTYDAMKLYDAREVLKERLTQTPAHSLASHEASVRLSVLREMKDAYSTAIHWEDVREWIDARIRAEAGGDGV